MYKKNIVGIKDYANLLQQVNDLLNSPFSKITKQYTGFPNCEINFLDKEKKDVSIEIRFEEITITCTFNSNDVCNSVFLFPDSAEKNNEFIK